MITILLLIGVSFCVFLMFELAARSVYGPLVSDSNVVRNDLRGVWDTSLHRNRIRILHCPNGYIAMVAGLGLLCRYYWCSSQDMDKTVRIWRWSYLHKEIEQTWERFEAENEGKVVRL